MKRPLRFWMLVLLVAAGLGFGLYLALANEGDYNDPVIAGLGQLLGTAALVALVVLAVVAAVGNVLQRRARLRPSPTTATGAPLGGGRP